MAATGCNESQYALYNWVDWVTKVQARVASSVAVTQHAAGMTSSRVSASKAVEVDNRLVVASQVRLSWQKPPSVDRIHSFKLDQVVSVLVVVVVVSERGRFWGLGFMVR